MKREQAETYILAGVGAIEGFGRYYVKPALEDLAGYVVSKVAHVVTGGMLPVDLEGLDEHMAEVIAYQDDERMAA